MPLYRCSSPSAARLGQPVLLLGPLLHRLVPSSQQLLQPVPVRVLGQRGWRLENLAIAGQRHGVQAVGLGLVTAGPSEVPHLVGMGDVHRYLTLAQGLHHQQCMPVASQIASGRSQALSQFTNSATPAVVLAKRRAFPSSTDRSSCPRRSLPSLGSSVASTSRFVMMRCRGSPHLPCGSEFPSIRSERPGALWEGCPTARRPSQARAQLTP